MKNMDFVILKMTRQFLNEPKINLCSKNCQWLPDLNELDPDLNWLDVKPAELVVKFTVLFTKNLWVEKSDGDNFL